MLVDEALGEVAHERRRANMRASSCASIETGFHGSAWAPRSRESSSQSWTKTRARVGLGDDLRHSAASDAINAGVPLAVVGKILGHLKASTAQRYTHLGDQAVANGVEHCEG